MATPTLVRSYVQADAVGTASTVTVASVNTTGGTLLLVKTMMGYNENSKAMTGFTFNGSGAGVAAVGSVVAGAKVWVYQLNAPTETTADVVVNFSTGSFAYNVVIVEVWSNTHATTPTKTAFTNDSGAGAAASISTTVTSGVAEDVINTAVCGRNNSTGMASFTFGAGETEIQDLNSSVASLHCTGASSYKAGGTSVTVTATPNVTAPLAIVAFPIAASAAGGGAEGAARYYYNRMMGV